ncbi:MAG: HlyC/CorC family transporter [Rickettsiaceae bacterium]|nr:HlyC/CorC family transporter [Rickettsiaceae bacterium]MDP5020749.1 HlyC/CorC family transporter [Rickettsiaceae bacterium]MDP5083472.1 HlyC/CorC family transporter [Rickettsiaceae bacterium]
MFFIVVSVIICLLGAAALISATETAITATSQGLIQKMKSEGSRRAELLLSLLKRKEKVISTLLIGNSLANTLCTIMATSLFIEFLGDDLGTLVSSIVMSFSIIVFSEVVPKAIAVAKPEKIALLATPILLVFLKILQPINVILAYIIKAFCFVMRIDLNQQVSASDEVRGVIEHHMHEGNVVKNDRDMLGGILNLKDMVIADIMVHRSNIVAMNIAIKPEKIIDKVLSSPHTRVPFWEGDHDNIIGVLHVKDLLSKLYSHTGPVNDIDVRALLSEPIFIPDNALVTQQLQTFREGQSHLACVVDEYGDLQGIITLEDILEEIVGQIYDEYDSGKNKVTKKSEHEYIIDGSMPVRDLNRELSWTLPETDATTIAGFVIHRLERIPNQGEYLIEKNLKIIVQKKSENRIKTILVVVQQGKGSK